MTASASSESLETRDGTRLRVRPIRADDIERERDFIRGLSEEARYNRLMYSLREPSPSLLRQLVDIDQINTVALVAVDTRDKRERFVAVARYGRDHERAAAEFAVVVADEWQGRGVGTRLARMLFAHAAAHGVQRIYGTILAHNQRMIALAQYLGMHIESSPEDPSLVVASLDLPQQTSSRQ